MTESNAKVLVLLNDLIDNRWWGSIALKIQNGEIIHLTKEESIQPSSLTKPEHRRTSIAISH